MEGRLGREAEAICSRADRGGAQAGRGGVAVAVLIRKAGITEQTYYRWKKAYCSLEVDQVRQLRQLQYENARLKKLVAAMTLDKAMLQDAVKKSGECRPDSAHG